MGDNRPVTVTSPENETAGPEQPAPRTRATGRRAAQPAAPDQVLVAAVDQARAAAVEEAGADRVGEHLWAVAEGDRVVTHSFACSARGYRGWRWAVTVARAPRSKLATVSEVVLLPDRDAVIPPAWLPWSDRLAPGDLGVGDALPYRADDPYLEQGYEQVPQGDPDGDPDAGLLDDDTDRLARWELGLGRPRVLSLLGREAAATRWYASDRGPTGEEALHASAACATCGYFLPLAGAMRRVFGVCANEWSPSDAKVVSLDHGCGAHSETDVEQSEPIAPPPPILDETGAEAVSFERNPVAAEVVDAEPAAVAEVAEPVDLEPVDVEPDTEEPADAEPTP
jgi:hypothetical protein